MWFFTERSGSGAFHRQMAPEWPVGKPIAFTDARLRPAVFREMSGDLRACVAPLDESVELVVDPGSGTPAITGLVDGLWPFPEVPAQKRTKADLKREKKARGRARG